LSYGTFRLQFRKINTIMLSFKNFILEKHEVKYEYSCVMLRVPKDVSDRIKKWTKKNLLATMIFDTPDKDKGVENDHHITALYGLYKTTADKVIKKLKNEFLGPVNLELGRISLFKVNKDEDPYDVLKIDVISEDLIKINTFLRESFPYKSDYPDYKPHLTIAYCNKNQADKFKGCRDFEGIKIKTNKLVFSPPNNGKDINFDL
jgi:2'-5' RNA ligase